jgi:hypothetical protein
VGVALSGSRDVFPDGDRVGASLHLLIGRSFNDSASADSRNAENVTFIDSPDVAGWFLADLRQVGIGRDRAGGTRPRA